MLRSAALPHRSARRYGLLGLGGLLLAIFAGCASEEGDRDGFQESDKTTNGDAPGGNGDGTDPGSSGGFGPGVGTLKLDPVNTTVIIDTSSDPATPGTLAYKVSSNGKDVTADAKFAVADATLGSFSGATFTSAAKLPAGKLGVSTTVQATTSEGTALGTLTVVALRQAGDQRDFFFLEPYKEDPSPKNDKLKFATNIKQVDVVFNMDTTGSMGGSITNLKNALSGTLLAQLQAAIPSVGLGVVDYRDYPVGGLFGYGSSGDWPVKVRQTMTTNLSAAQAAVGQYVAGGGGDTPEATIPSLQHILTGEELAWSGGKVAAHASPGGGAWGAVDFRPGSVPVLVNIGDAVWHSESKSPYNFKTPTMASLKAAFAARSAFFVDVSSGDQSQARELSDATKSYVHPSAFGGACGANKCCTGKNGAGQNPDGPGGTCRLVFQHANGNGVSTGIVKAIQAISVGAAYDVTAKASNDPKNPNGVDATKFIKALRAMDEGDAAAGCPAWAAKDTNGDGVNDTFSAVKVGTKVCFEVIPAKNDTVPPENEPQFYNALIDVIGVQGNVQLDSRTVIFLVPPKDPGVN